MSKKQKPVITESIKTLDFPVYYANGERTCCADYTKQMICPFLGSYLGVKHSCTVSREKLNTGEAGFLVPGPNCILRERVKQ